MPATENEMILFIILLCSLLMNVSKKRSLKVYPMIKLGKHKVIIDFKYLKLYL